MFLIYKFRVFILTILTLLNLGFIISLPFGHIPHSLEYWALGTILNFLLALIAVYLLQVENSKQANIEKLELLTNSSPYNYIFYDCNKSHLFISQPIANLFHITKKDKYEFEDLENFFNPHEWEEIKQLTEQQLGDFSEKKGTIELPAHYENKERYIKYHAKVILDKQLLLDGLIIWFTEDTEATEIENELIKLVKKYRLISFENDSTLNSLPFPIWRRDKSNEIIFYNTHFSEVLEDMKAHKTENSLSNSLSQLATKAIQVDRPQKLIHKIKIRNKVYTYEFFEIPLGLNVGTVGYASNIEHHKEIGQKAKTLKESFNTLLEISSRAHIMLNYKQEIVSFNKNILELYNLDYHWMKTHPTFSSFIDMLHEIHKLPEVQDYKTYKEKLLKLTRELTYQYSELMHLPNSTTLSYYFIPLKDGSMLITIDDISESLNLERTLNEQITVQSQILNYIEYPIIVIGQDARVKSFNEAMINCFNLDINFTSATPKIENLLEKMLANNEAAIKKLTEATLRALEMREETTIVDDIHNQIWQIKNLPDSSIIILIKNIL